MKMECNPTNKFTNMC